MKRKLILIFLFLFISYSYSQDTAALHVEIQAEVSETVVPLNRECLLTVNVIWHGDHDSVIIEKVEEPLLTNFSVKGVSSSNIREGGSEGMRSVRRFTWVLQPNALGMAYIEAVGLTYTDQASGKSLPLVTQRFGVEITEPAAEDRGRPLFWPYIAGFLLLAGTVFWYYSRRQNESSAAAEEPQIVSEEKALEELLDLRKASQPVSELYLAGAKLLKQYVKDIYNLPAGEISNAGLFEAIEKCGTDSVQTELLEKMIKKYDRIRFSGEHVNENEWTEAYTAVEKFIRTNLEKINNEKSGKNDVKKGFFSKVRKQ